MIPVVVGVPDTDAEIETVDIDVAIGSVLREGEGTGDEVGAASVTNPPPRTLPILTPVISPARTYGKPSSIPAGASTVIAN